MSLLEIVARILSAFAGIIFHRRHESRLILWNDPGPMADLPSSGELRLCRRGFVLHGSLSPRPSS
jgi:hypothetical protein